MHLRHPRLVLQRTRLLDPDECVQVRDDVLTFRRLWTRRHDELPSFTLGAASYLDVPEHGVVGYIARNVRTRQRLLKRFEDLYVRLQNILSEITGAPTFVHPRLAPPGFHIFEAHPGIMGLNPKIHFDRQHFFFDWEDPNAFAPDHQLSFTAAIALPDAGAGLYMWPIRSADHTGEEEERRARLAASERVYEPYSLGQLVIHSGDHLHQIAPSEMIDAEVRLTLQGHAQKEGDRWWLYW
ncbi:MAG: hypothetical protein AAF449_05125 [Myxococcota bacterium]